MSALFRKTIPALLSQTSRSQAACLSQFNPICGSCQKLQYGITNNRVLDQPRNIVTPPSRNIVTGSTSVSQGFFGKVKESLGFSGKLRYSKTILMRSSLRLYLCCVELPDYEAFFKELELEDTFQSWYKITELHVWMAMVRLASEGKEGQLMRKLLVGNMWQDVEKKSSSLGGSSSARKEQIYEISQQFKGALFSYDEGVLSDDKVLAGALWRNFFHKDDINAQQLELMVHYIRKQLSHLDHQESEVLVRSGLICWLPLRGDVEDQERNNQILKYIVKRA